MKSPPAQVKGSVVLSRLELIAAKGVFEQVMAALPADDQSVWRGIVLAVSWYPFEMAQRLDQAIATVMSPKHKRQFFLDMGRASADANLSNIHKAFVHVGDPHYLLSRAPQIYSKYYDKGRRTYEKSSPTSCLLKTFEAESVTLDDCLTVVGWHVRAIEICGGKSARVKETLCRARGDDHCEYHCSWSE
ncbi:MAG: hypothetical protein JWN44_1994 [Myxococcales bacterium]|nr:hypothetical protein [Myxococcales bacterium]